MKEGKTEVGQVAEGSALSTQAAIFKGYTSYARDLRADGQRETQRQALMRVYARATNVITDITRRGTLPLLLSPGFPGVVQGDQTLDTKDAARLLRGTRGYGVAFHHLVLSPHPSIPVEERPPYEMYTRAALETLRRRKCYPTLVWMAVHHTDTTHPHVHVLLLGYQPRRYGERPLTLVREDARAMGDTVAARCDPIPVERLWPGPLHEVVALPVPTVVERGTLGRAWGGDTDSDTDGDGP